MSDAVTVQEVIDFIVAEAKKDIDKYVVEKLLDEEMNGKQEYKKR